MMSFKTNAILLLCYGLVCFIFTNLYHSYTDTQLDLDNKDARSSLLNSISGRHKHTYGYETQIENIVDIYKEGYQRTVEMGNMSYVVHGANTGNNTNINRILEEADLLNATTFQNQSSNQDRILSLATQEGKWSFSVQLNATRIQNYIQGKTFEQVKPVDILKEKPLNFIPTLRNPCVFVPVSSR